MFSALYSAHRDAAPFLVSQTPPFYIFSVILTVRTFFLYTIIFVSVAVPSTAQPVIRSIEIIRHDVFDSTDGKFFTIYGNALHSLTDESVIRRELLFTAGDPVNADVLYESERNLRRLGFIGDVEIISEMTGDSSVRVNVVTYDKWTLNVGSSVKHEGGITTVGASASENNFLGYGKTVGIGYNYVSDRSTPNGFDAMYRDRRLFGSDYYTLLQYKNSEDLTIKTMLLERPFYTEATESSYGIYGEQGKERKRLFVAGVLQHEDFLTFHSAKAWWISSLNNDRKYRYGAAFINQANPNNENYTSAVPRTSLLNVMFGILKREYSPSRHIDNLGTVVEDVPHGYSVSLVAGKVLNRTDAYFLHQSNQLSVHKNMFSSSSSVSFQGYLTGSRFNDASAAFRQTAFLKTSPLNTVAARFIAFAGINWSAGQQIYLDSKNGLRGVRAYGISGTSGLLFNIENRFSPGWQWWIFKLGLVGFTDVGVAAKAFDRLPDTAPHTSLGLGVRIFNTKQQGSGLTRIDVAYNLNAKSVEIILSANQLFNAFQVLETASPALAQ